MKIFVNMITTSRFVLSLFLPWIQFKMDAIFFLGYIVALFLTDAVDGFLARTFHVQSVFGALMDTIADKTLNIVLLVCLLKECSILWGVLLLEISIATINAIALIKGKKTRASIFGKAKMWLLAFSVIFGYLYHYDMCDINWVYSSSIIAMASQLVTLIDYIKTLLTQNTKKWYDGEKVKWTTLLFSTDYYMNNKV